MNISIIGAGYVGLISSLCFSHVGHKVICYDHKKKVIQNLNNYKLSIYEKNAEKYLKKYLGKKFFPTSNFEEIINYDTDIVIIAVGTPDSGGQINLNFIENALKNVAKKLKFVDKYISIIIKSTVVPGTTDTLIKKIIEKYSKKKLGEYGLGMNPEFLREGSAIYDFMNPDRIVIGYEDKKTKLLLLKLYSHWKTKKIIVNSRTAEAIKYSSNCILASQISLMNELSNYSRLLKFVDFKDILTGVHYDRRWMPFINKNKNRLKPEILNYHMPGIGYGGSCLPKDTNALISQAKKIGVNLKFLESVVNTNFNQIFITLNLIKSFIKFKPGDKILILGVAFKPNTDDIRESPSIKFIHEFYKLNLKVYVHDPMAITNLLNVKSIKSKVKVIKNWKETSKKVKLIFLATAWQEYKELQEIYLAEQIIFDGRNFLNHKKIICKKYLSLTNVS